VVPNAEPYKKRTAHGMILGEGGEKMSKSRGNVVNPNDIVAQYGADTMRTYIMFIGDFAKAAAWSPKAVAGCKRFLDRVWNLQEQCSDSLEYSEANVSAIHKAIKKVNEDIEAMKFNTGIATLMALVNDFYANGCTKGDMKALVLMLSPVAPHICEEIWENLGFASEGMICQQKWPEYDESKTIAATVQLAVQVAGKVRANIIVPVDADDQTVVDTALAEPKIQKQAEGKTLVKQIVVRDKKSGSVKIVNLIFK
jgi:leucyl-tRNA synthetase